MPLTFLSGVFYSVEQLPDLVKRRFSNPFFYMIDGFRYGFFASQLTPISFISLFADRRFLAQLLSPLRRHCL